MTMNLMRFGLHNPLDPEACHGFFEKTELLFGRSRAGPEGPEGPEGQAGPGTACTGRLLKSG